MRLILIRHGETDLNKEQRLQGARGPDLPLNEEGRRQVEQLRNTLTVTPTKIYCSPLLRTRQTAEIINERFSIPIILNDNLRERDFGSLSGKLRNEVGEVILANDLNGRYDYRPFGGESMDNVTERLIDFLSILPLQSDETIFVVSHRGIIRILYELYPDQIPSQGSTALPGTMHTFTITALPSKNK